jgi:hypothetical protein
VPSTFCLLRLQLLNVQPGTPKRRAQQPRWVPYTHSNGLAIYQHQGKDSSTTSGKGGEEYMVRVMRQAVGVSFCLQETCKPSYLVHGCCSAVHMPIVLQDAP